MRDTSRLPSLPMHDDDDPPEESLGKILDSGIGSCVDRADYALPLGEPALQDGDAEAEFAPRQWTRRSVILFGLGGGVVCGAGLIGVVEYPRRNSNHPASSVAQPSQGRTVDASLSPDVLVLIEGARQLAGAPIEDLLRAYPTFVWIVERHGAADESLWGGIERLGTYALVDKSEKGFRIAKRLVAAFKIGRPPVSAKSRLPLLQELVWDWESKRRK